MRVLPQAPGFAGRIDRLVEMVAPEWAMRRAASRAALYEARSGAYEGARYTRLNSDWNAAGMGSADSDLLSDLATLRNRSRDLVRNDAIAASIVRAITDNVVGTGIRPQSRLDAKQIGISPDAAKEWQRTAERLWRQWTPFADTCMRTDFYGLQGIVTRKLVEDGEVFSVPVMVQEPNRPFETSIDLVEADRVSNPNGTATAERIRDGVVLGKRGQPVAYYVQVQHPGDSGQPGFDRAWKKVKTWDSATGRRLVHHIYQLLRPGQTRGAPMLAPVIPTMRNLAKYGESEEVAARVAALFVAFRKKPEVFTGRRVIGSTAKDGRRIDHLRPGIIEELEPGESMEFANPSRPASNFSPYVEMSIRKIGAAIGMPLELILCDFSKTTWTSGRMSMIEAERFFERLQMLLVERFCQPVWEALIEECWLTGKLDAPDFLARRDLWCAANWIPPARGWVDPEKEANGAEKRVTLGLSSTPRECMAQGVDWEEVLEEQAAYVDRKKELAPEPSPGMMIDKDGNEVPKPTLPNGEPAEDDEEPPPPKKEGPVDAE